MEEKRLIARIATSTEVFQSLRAMKIFSKRGVLKVSIL